MCRTQGGNGGPNAVTNTRGGEPRMCHRLHAGPDREDDRYCWRVLPRKLRLGCPQRTVVIRKRVENMACRYHGEIQVEPVLPS
jgi:hypothetical protein